MEIDRIKASIEGRGLDLRSKKIVPGGPRRFDSRPGLPTMVIYPVSIDAQGEAEIVRAYDPQICVIYENSLLDLASKIRGTRMWGFSDKPPGKRFVGGAAKSAKHKNQGQPLRGNVCLMELIEGYDYKSLQVHPKDLIIEAESFPIPTE